MITFFKILHLLALMFGSVAALGNIYLGISKGPHDLAAPAYTNTLRKFYRVTSLVAIITLWISGLLLMVIGYGGWVPGSAFSAKIGLVILLTAIILFVNFMAPSWARNGGPPSYLPTLSWISALTLIAIVIMAALTFTSSYSPSTRL